MRLMITNKVSTTVLCLLDDYGLIHSDVSMVVGWATSLASNIIVIE